MWNTIKNKTLFTNNLKQYIYKTQKGRYNSVGIATGYVLDGPGIEFR
jgi:hypothetical protein